MRFLLFEPAVVNKYSLIELLHIARVLFKFMFSSLLSCIGTAFCCREMQSPNSLTKCPFNYLELCKSVEAEIISYFIAVFGKMIIWVCFCSFISLKKAQKF